jgi:DNA-directed RNA polymerase specialized sigma subunit
MDNWSASSAELMEIVLQKPEATQKEIGEMLGIKQNSVSGRWSRAKVSEIMEVEQMFRQKVKLLLP